MELCSTPAELFVRQWGEPLREALFQTRDGYAIRVFKWVEGEGEEELTLYRTSGVCDIPVPGAVETHRQEFFLGCDPECDEIARIDRPVGPLFRKDRQGSFGSEYLSVGQSSLVGD